MQEQPAYYKGAQKSVVDGITLYRKRFYLPFKTMERLHNEAERLNITPSELLTRLINQG